MDAIVIDARTQALIAQRDQALNQVVMLAGEIAKLQAQIQELTPKTDDEE